LVSVISRPPFFSEHPGPNIFRTLFFFYAWRWGLSWISSGLGCSLRSIFCLDIPTGFLFCTPSPVTLPCCYFHSFLFAAGILHPFKFSFSPKIFFFSVISEGIANSNQYALLIPPAAHPYIGFPTPPSFRPLLAEKGHSRSKTSVLLSIFVFEFTTPLQIFPFFFAQKYTAEVRRDWDLPGRVSSGSHFRISHCTLLLPFSLFHYPQYIFPFVFCERCLAFHHDRLSSLLHLFFFDPATGVVLCAFRGCKSFFFFPQCGLSLVSLQYSFSYLWASRRSSACGSGLCLIVGLLVFFPMLVAFGLSLPHDWSFSAFPSQSLPLFPKVRGLFPPSLLSSKILNKRKARFPSRGCSHREC